jgi:hypothetical protein
MLSGLVAGFIRVGQALLSKSACGIVDGKDNGLVVAGYASRQVYFQNGLLPQAQSMATSKPCTSVS